MAPLHVGYLYHMALGPLLSHRFIDSPQAVLHPVLLFSTLLITITVVAVTVDLLQLVDE